MTYASLIKPWRMPRRNGARRMPYRRPSRGQYAVGATLALPVVLSLITAYYAAYVYWVLLVTSVYLVIWSVAGVIALVRAVMRRRAFRNIRKGY